MAGRTYDLVNYTWCWGQPRVYFYDDTACLRSIPVAWTSVAVVDPFIAAAADRCAFRFEDLVDLSHMLREVGRKV